MDWAYSWVNKPFYPFVYKALFHPDNFVSKIYVSTFFESWQNVMITAKFGFKWLFFQPNPEKYGLCAYTFYKTTRDLIDKFIKDEGLDAWKDLGYDDKGLVLILGHDKGEKAKSGTNFPAYKPGLDKVFPGRKYKEISRNEHPELFKIEVDDRLELLPGAKNYTTALYR